MALVKAVNDKTVVATSLVRRTALMAFDPFRFALREHAVDAPPLLVVAGERRTENEGNDWRDDAPEARTDSGAGVPLHHLVSPRGPPA
jgi:hypothetical protein